MVKTGLSAPRARTPLRTILRAGPAGAMACRPDAVMVEAGAGLAARLESLMGAAPILLLRLPGLDGDLDATLAVACPRVDGIVLGGCRHAGDLARLGTRLAVAEALAGRPDGAVATLAEPAPEALLAPMGLAAARPRLAGLLWDATALARACGAAPAALAEGHPADTVRTLLALAGAALAVPIYDGASDDPGLEPAAAAARRLGFAGKVAAHPGQVAALARIFAAAPQPM